MIEVADSLVDHHFRFDDFHVDDEDDDEVLGAGS
jgi:hypothetical protein